MTLAEFLISDKEEHLRCLEKTYRGNFNFCIAWIIKNHPARQADAKDIFTESLVILSENAFKNKIQPSDTLVSTYLLAVCKNLIRQSERNQKFQEISTEYLPDDIYQEESDFDLAENEKKLLNLNEALEKLGHPCNTIIREFYLNQTRQEKITEILGYQNTDVTKTMKYKCLGRLKEIFFKMYKRP